MGKQKRKTPSCADKPKAGAAGHKKQRKAALVERSWRPTSCSWLGKPFGRASPSTSAKARSALSGSSCRAWAADGLPLLLRLEASRNGALEWMLSIVSGQNAPAAEGSVTRGSSLMARKRSCCGVTRPISSDSELQVRKRANHFS
jgi:hypothetical protein